MALGCLLPPLLLECILVSVSGRPISLRYMALSVFWTAGGMLWLTWITMLDSHKHNTFSLVHRKNSPRGGIQQKTASHIRFRAAKIDFLQGLGYVLSPVSAPSKPPEITVMGEGHLLWIPGGSIRCQML
jgi:hypothetical protein